MVIKMMLRNIARIVLVIIITALMVFLCRYFGEGLFSSYYAAEWGTSAQIMHSPPFGENYTNKLAIVIRWSMGIGLIFGLICSILIYKRLDKSVLSH